MKDIDVHFLKTWAHVKEDRMQREMSSQISRCENKGMENFYSYNLYLRIMGEDFITRMCILKD
jgi:hypothetical protein